MGNKKYLITALCITAFTLIILWAKPYLKARYTDEYTNRGYEPVVAFYDHNIAHVHQYKGIKHCTLIWRNTAFWFDNTQLKQALNQDVLITIETWSKSTFFNTGTNNDVLTETLIGKFDDKIAALGQLAKTSKHKVLVRWNPHMEVPANLYPWQQQSPQVYVKAFNYFTTKLKALAPQVKIVWGPSGYPGDTEYWPIHNCVDLVSISLGSDSENSLTTGAATHEPLPYVNLQRKLHRMRFINKPVIILGSEQAASSKFNYQLFAQIINGMNQYRNTVYSPGNFILQEPRKPKRDLLNIGVFDPQKKLVNNPLITIEHIFTDWGDIERGVFKKILDSVTSRHHDIIVTVEPWRDTSGITDPDVLQSTINGRYDGIIKKLSGILSATNQTVYLRWAHEMEIPIHRYAWQSKNPVTYINAYRYFMQFFTARNIRKVWGPAGDRGSADWWPGDDVVDFISIAIYGLPDKNITNYRQQESFATIFGRKNYRMRFFNKPIFITEFGVKGPESFQQYWLTQAAGVVKNNPQVWGVCYFNLRDNPKAWGNIEAPDWSISPATLQRFNRAVR